MSVFSSKKKTFVSSVVYNMAGDIKDRPDYLKTMLVSHVLSERPITSSLTRTSLQNYLTGPGVDLRRFGRWARLNGYNTNLGEVQSTISVPFSIDPELVSAELEEVFGNALYINKTEFGVADYGVWANQYMLKNHVDKYLTEWEADFNESTGQITIQIPLMPLITFTPVGYVQSAQYMYVSLNQEKQSQSSSEISEWLAGQPVIADGYILQSTQTTDSTVLLQNDVSTVQVLNGGVPYETSFSSPHSETVSLTRQLYTRKSNLQDAYPSLVVGAITESIETREVYDIVEKTSTTTLTETVANGTRVSEITNTSRTLEKHEEYRQSTVTVREKSWVNEEIFIYQYGTGNLMLDSLFVSRSAAGSFFPSIPLRIDNRSVTDTQYDDILPWVKKAVSRATDISFEKLQDIVEDNPNLGDIDFAYVLFGASLNSTENASKRYVYEFFRNAGQDSAAVMQQFMTNYSAAKASWEAWTRWYESGRHDSSKYGLDNLMPAEPVRLPMPTLPRQSINIRSQYNYNITIDFSVNGEEILSGKYLPTAKVNSLRIYKGSSYALEEYPEQGLFGGAFGRFMRRSSDTLQTVIIDWQYSENAYRRLTLIGLKHVNHVYGGKSVEISGWTALDDSEESGFIIPLQEETLRGLPLPVTTQLTTASTYMMFNSYQVVKQRWYQRGIFKAVLIIATVIISIVFPPAGAAAGGILGTNLAVGTTLGFTGTAALVAGAVANAVVAMIVTELVMRASVKLLGPKLGGIIGAVLSFVTVSFGTSLAGGPPMTVSFGNLVSAENLMKLTSALSTGISAYIAAGSKDIAAQTEAVLADYKKQAKAIAEKYTQQFGGASGVIDPLAIADVFQFQIEDPDVFFNRTLMNGTDIADMSHDMMDNFTSLTTALPLE